MAIHPAAVIEDGACVGDDVDVGPFAVLRRGAQVGDGCRIGPHAVVCEGAQLGERCTLHAHAVVGDVPQDTAFESMPSRVVIGPGCVLREGVTVHRGTKPDSETRIGAGCLLMTHAHVGHNCVLGDRVILVSGVLLAGYVEVGAGAFLSGNCVVHQFTRIGRLAMLSGSCGVGKDIPPFCVVPALTLNRVAGLNVVGMRRAGMPPAERLDVKRAYALLYRSGLNVAEAVRELRKAFSDGPAAEFAPFIEASRRGLCPGLERGRRSRQEAGTSSGEEGDAV